MVVRAPGQDETVLPAAAPGEAPRWGAFYADVEHEVLPVTRGLRVTLTYHLYAAGFGDVPRLPASLLRTGEAGSLTILGAALNWTARTFNRPTTRFERTTPLAFALAHKYTENTLPNVRAEDEEGNEIWTRDPARLRGRDAVLYATLDKALRAYCGPNPGDDDFDDEMCYMPRPPLRVELIKIRDFVPPRDGEAPKFWVGDINTWDGNWSGRGQRTRFVNPDEFAETLKRAPGARAHEPLHGQRGHGVRLHLHLRGHQAGRVRY